MSSTQSPRFLSRLDGSIALSAIGAEFHGRGWSVGTSSNYSVILGRDPLELLLTASGKDKGRLSQEDFVSVDAAGKPTEEGQPKSSAETLLHVVIAELFPDVGAILHTHSVNGTVLSRRFGDEGGFAIEGFEMLKGLEGIRTHDHRQWVPIFENTQDIAAMAQDIRFRCEDANCPFDILQYGFLIRGHGLYTWGRDLFAARRHVEIFEFLFDCVCREQM
ncbi:MAG: methylthioribulose 1-phosphate dehydratase [Planctomycetota bacterium]